MLHDLTLKKTFNKNASIQLNFRLHATTLRRYRFIYIRIHVLSNRIRLMISRRVHLKAGFHSVQFSERAVVLLDNTHFKRKRSHKIERSLNCTESKSGFSISALWICIHMRLIEPYVPFIMILLYARLQLSECNAPKTFGKRFSNCNCRIYSKYWCYGIFEVRLIWNALSGLYINTP